MKFLIYCKKTKGCQEDLGKLLYFTVIKKRDETKFLNVVVYEEREKSITSLINGCALENMNYIGFPI